MREKQTSETFYGNNILTYIYVETEMCVNINIYVT